MFPLASTFPPPRQDLPNPSSERLSARTPSTEAAAAFDRPRSRAGDPNPNVCRSRSPSRSESRSEGRQNPAKTFSSSRVSSDLSSEHSASSSDRLLNQERVIIPAAASSSEPVTLDRGFLRVLASPDLGKPIRFEPSEPSARVKPLTQTSTTSDSFLVSTNSGALLHVTGSESPSFPHHRDLLLGVASAPGTLMTSPERMDAFEALVRATSQELPLHAAVDAEAVKNKQRVEAAEPHDGSSSRIVASSSSAAASLAAAASIGAADAAGTAAGEAAAGSLSKPSVQPSADVPDASRAVGAAEVVADVDADVSNASPSKKELHDALNVTSKNFSPRRQNADSESPADGSPTGVRGNVTDCGRSQQFKVRWGKVSPADLLLLLSPTVASSVKVQPTGGGPYGCGVCEKRFPSLNALDAHDHSSHGTGVRHGYKDVDEISPQAAGLLRGRAVRKGRATAAAVAGRVVGDSIYESTDPLRVKPQGGAYRSKRLRVDRIQQPASTDLFVEREPAGSVRGKRAASAAAEGRGGVHDRLGLCEGDAMVRGRVTVTSPVAGGSRSKRSKIIAAAVAAAAAADEHRLAADAAAAEDAAEGAAQVARPPAWSDAEDGVGVSGGGNVGARAENQQEEVATRKGRGGGKGKSQRRGRLTGRKIEAVSGLAGEEGAGGAGGERTSTLGSAEARTSGEEKFGEGKVEPEGVTISGLARNSKQKRKGEMSAMEATQHLAKCQVSHDSSERGAKGSQTQFTQSSGSALGPSGDLLSLIASQQPMMKQTWQKQHGERQQEEGKQLGVQADVQPHLQPGMQCSTEEYQQDHQDQQQQQQIQQLSLLEQLQEMLQLQIQQQPQQQPQQQQNINQQQQHQNLDQLQKLQAPGLHAPNISFARSSSQPARPSLSNVPSYTSMPVSPHPSHRHPAPSAAPAFRTPSSHTLASSPPPLPPPHSLASAAVFPARSPAPATQFRSSVLHSPVPPASRTPGAVLQSPLTPESAAAVSPNPGAMSGAASGVAAASGATQGTCGLSGEHALRSALVSAIMSRIGQITGQGGPTQSHAQMLAQLQSQVLGQAETNPGAASAGIRPHALAHGPIMQQPVPAAAAPAGARAPPGQTASTALAGSAHSASAYFVGTQRDGPTQNGSGQGTRGFSDLDLELRL
ncbi:hypothetical protein CLOM_g19591 [Closterium sp. NIES-68]|nr:hypothetical protein CLOM_g19591 [Closterium sp. NIES-68]GJP83495.1 hypothetical protein CLOP_g13641 [Closterium sp. NIES-67]